MLKKMVMKNWFQTAMFSILSIIACFGVYNIAHVLLTYVGVEQRLAEITGRFLSSIGILILYHQLFDIKKLGIKKENFFKGLITGGFLFVVTLCNFLLLLVEYSEYPVIVPPLYVIMIVAMEQISVGIFEEFLFRGLILNTFLEKMKNHQLKGKIIAIILSSVLFGLTHFLNLFEHPNMIYTSLVEVCFATFTGIFLGALYLRSKNIWVVVFYHTLVDLVSDFTIIFYKIPVTAMEDMIFTEAMLNILVNTIFIFAGIFLARKLKE